MLNPIESEAVLLYRAWSIVDSAVNHEVFVKPAADEVDYLRPNHQLAFKYFYIMLVEFMKGVDEDFSDKKENVVTFVSRNKSGNLNPNNAEWNALYCSANDLKRFWSFHVEQDLLIDFSKVRLRAKIKEIVSVYGNYFKHDVTSLSTSKDKVRKWLEGYQCGYKYNDFMLIEDVYHQFADSFMQGMATVLACYVSSFRNSIFIYLQGEFRRAYKKGKDLYYEYDVPSSEKNRYAYFCYWELMNKVRDGLSRGQLFFPKFELSDGVRRIWLSDYRIELP